jgi:integrase
VIELSLQNYVEWRVSPITPVRDGYGYRVFLKYADGTKKTQQKSGFTTKKEANVQREETIAELHSGTYIVHSNVKVQEFMEFWLENDIKRRTDSYDTFYSYSGIVKNHIVPTLGRKKMVELTRADIQRLYNEKAEYSRSVAEQIKVVMNVSLRYGVNLKVIASNPAEGINLPRKRRKNSGGTRGIDVQKTLTQEQIFVLLEKSRDTPIHMQVLFNVLMGLRRGEINGVKYSDVDYVNRTLKVTRQLGTAHNTQKEDDFAPKSLTKQEIGLKTESSYREIPIPDYVFEAILHEREVYEKNKSRRKKEFQDLDYICCSTYGRPRSKNFHWKYYKQLLQENGLPDIRWHDLRSTFCTLLLKNDFSPKAVAKLMGHSKEIITMDVYGDNRGIIVDGVPEIESYMDEVLPDEEERDSFEKELLDIVIDVTEFLPNTA